MGVELAHKNKILIEIIWQNCFAVRFLAGSQEPAHRRHSFLCREEVTVRKCAAFSNLVLNHYYKRKKEIVMKKFLKRAVVITLTVAMAATMMTGCKKKKKDAATLVVGTNAEFEPFEYVSSKDAVIDKYSGIDIEIIKKVGEENNKTVKIENMEFDSLIIALNQKKVDAVIAGMTITPERSEEVDFSEPYYTAKQVMIVREDNTDITKAADMSGKKIAVIQGFTGQTVVEDDLKFPFEAFKKGTEAVTELKNGKCDVVVIDSATANQYLKENEGLKIVEDNEAFESEEYGIAVRKGDKDTLDMVNASVKKFKEDGTIDAISAKYAAASETAEDSEEPSSEEGSEEANTEE